MISTKKLTAAKKFGPGYFIKEQMDIRGWVQEELAEVLEISMKHLNSIILDKQALNIEIARKLSIAFGTSAQYWLNLDNDYRLWLEEKKKDVTASVQIKSLIYNRMPLRDMIKKGWLKESANIAELETQVKDFWSINTLDLSFIEMSMPLYKRSGAYNQFNASYAATWFQMAKKISMQYNIPAYNKRALRELSNSLSSFTFVENGIELFLERLNDCGVKFFILPHLEKTYLDGAAFLLEGQPVVVYTARYKRIDNFWFTVAHEIAHILKHLIEKNDFLLDNLSKQDSGKQEVEANEFAATQLKHNEILEYLEPYYKYLSSSKIMECASKLNIHPAIVVGALAYNDTISYRNISLFNENVLTLIPKKFKHQSIEY